MVCIPCIVIPFVLWFFHKFIRPMIMKVWNPWSKQEKIKSTNSEIPGTETCGCESEKLPKDLTNGIVTNSDAVHSGEETNISQANKKTD